MLELGRFLPSKFPISKGNRVRLIWSCRLRTRPLWPHPPRSTSPHQILHLYRHNNDYLLDFENFSVLVQYLKEVEIWQACCEDVFFHSAWRGEGGWKNSNNSRNLLVPFLRLVKHHLTGESSKRAHCHYGLSPGRPQLPQHQRRHESWPMSVGRRRPPQVSQRPA